MMTKGTKGTLGMTALALMMAFSSVTFYSCKKNSAAENNVEATEPLKDSKAMTVANVYKKDDGKTVVVWFFETPLITEFTGDAAQSSRYFDVLSNAKEKQIPVNVKTAVMAPNKIEAVQPATESQIAAYKVEMSKTVAATEADKGPQTEGTAAPTLTAVIPNLATATNIFNALRNEGCRIIGPSITGQKIPFQYVADGCYARAHKMRQIIEGTYGYTSYKVFNYVDQCFPSGSLRVSATLWGNSCCVSWWYHVAPYVRVQTASGIVNYLMDPSMHTAPVLISTWLNAQKNTGCGYSNSTVTKQAYFTSSAYAPNSYNYSTCTAGFSTDPGYAAANATCAAYCPRSGCF